MKKRDLQNLASSFPVTNFADYRDYLAALYNQAKNNSERYSYEAFAEDLGFSAINSIRLVIIRQRLLSRNSAQTVVKSLNLRRAHRKYFLAAVDYANARNPEKKAEYFQKMLDAKNESTFSHEERGRITFLSEWHHWVILETLRLEGASIEPQRIAERLVPTLGTEKIRRSLALLESVGLLNVDKKTGKWTVVDDAPMIVPADQTAANLVMTKHHQSMLEVAKDALDCVPSEQREFDTITVSVSLESFRKINDLIKQLCSDILNIESKNQQRDCVAQINLNAFTLTKWEDRNDS